MRSFLRHVYRQMLPRSLALTADPFFSLRSGRPEVEGTRILILAPHPDDDIVCCGGIMQMYRDQGASIHCVFLTDGGQGNEAIPRDVLVARRKREAETAARMVGAGHITFLDYPDGQLSVSRNTVERLVRVLLETRPDTVFLPFYTDRHPDHAATSRIFSAASRHLPTVRCYAYSFWSPLPMYNVAVDITPYAEVKRRALEEHQSPRMMPTLTGACFGLSRYYALLALGIEGHAEVFLSCPSTEYRRLESVL